MRQKKKNHSIYKNACQYYEAGAFLRQEGFRLTDIIATCRGSNDALDEYDALS